MAAGNAQRSARCATRSVACAGTCKGRHLEVVLPAESDEQLNDRPGEIAPVAFHLRHIARSLGPAAHLCRRWALDEVQVIVTEVGTRPRGPSTMNFSRSWKLRCNEVSNACGSLLPPILKRREASGQETVADNDWWTCWCMSPTTRSGTWDKRLRRQSWWEDGKNLLLGDVRLYLTGTFMAQLFKSTFLILTALFPIVNPLGSAPLFLSLTHYYSAEERKILSRRIALNSIALIVVSYFIGTHISGIFWNFVAGGAGRRRSGARFHGLGYAETEGRGQTQRRMCIAVSAQQDLLTKAFYPLTLPLTVGPGSISVAITLGANEPHIDHQIIYSMMRAVIGAVLIAAIGLSLLCIRRPACAECLAKPG